MARATEAMCDGRAGKEAASEPAKKTHRITNEWLEVNAETLAEIKRLAAALPTREREAIWKRVDVVLASLAMVAGH